MAPGVIPEAMSGHRDRGDQIRILGSSVGQYRRKSLELAVVPEFGGPSG